MSCDLCVLIARSQEEGNPYAVVQTTTGYVALHNTQYHEGYTLFVAKQCVNELHELSRDDRDAHLHDMAEVAHAVFRAFRPQKLNYELLGNTTSHVHWHLFPRHGDDPRPEGPVWEDLDFLRALWSDTPLDPERLRTLKTRLLAELERVDVTIERRF